MSGILSNVVTPLSYRTGTEAECGEATIIRIQFHGYRLPFHGCLESTNYPYANNRFMFVGNMFTVWIPKKR